jgi:succinoglycan biosynthesis transport protein ExoP
LVFGCVAGCVGLAAALNEITTPIYRSSVRVEVQREASRSPLTGEVTESSTPQSDNQALYTTAQMVASREPMAEVVQALERQGTVLTSRPHPRPWPLGVRAAGSQLPAGTEKEKVDWLLSHVAVEPVRDTRLIRISVEHSDPATASTIANTIAQNFVRYQSGRRSAADNSVAAYLRSQAGDVKRKTESLEQQTGGSGRPGLFSLEGRIQQLTATAAEFNAAYAKTTTERLTISSQLDRIKGVARNPAIDPNEIPIQSESLDALKRNLLASNAALAKAGEIYGANHPKLVMLQSENEHIRRGIRAEIANAMASLESQRSILVGREVSLQMAIAQTGDELRSLNDQSRKYSSIESELKSNRDLYNLLMSRVREAEITGQITRPMIRIVEPASLELDAIRPRKWLNLAVSLLLGLFSGAGLALALESIRRTIRSPKDVDEVLQLPVLGLIPKDSLR